MYPIDPVLFFDEDWMDGSGCSIAAGFFDPKKIWEKRQRFRNYDNLCIKNDWKLWVWSADSNYSFKQDLAGIGENSGLLNKVLLMLSKAGWTKKNSAWRVSCDAKIIRRVANSMKSGLVAGIHGPTVRSDGNCPSQQSQQLVINNESSHEFLPPLLNTQKP